MKQKAAVLVALAALLVACGSTGAEGGGSGNGEGQPPTRFSGARTETCASVSGLTALYWDYMNGVIRADYPETIRQVPFNIGGYVINPVQPLYSLVYPVGWTGEALVNPNIQQTGLHVFRQDGHALWHRRNETLVNVFPSSADVARAAVNAFAGSMAPGSPVEVLCSADSQPGQFALDLSSRIVRMGPYLANVSVQTSYFGGGTVAFIQVALAPENEYDAYLYFVAFPLSAQMGLGGGSSEQPQCNDDLDNDGDGRTDYPDDPDCESPLDDSEGA